MSGKGSNVTKNYSVLRKWGPLGLSLNSDHGKMSQRRASSDSDLVKWPLTSLRFTRKAQLNNGIRGHYQTMRTPAVPSQLAIQQWNVEWRRSCEAFILRAERNWVTELSVGIQGHCWTSKTPAVPSQFVIQQQSQRQASSDNIST